jgi:hypothetical protein
MLYCISPVWNATRLLSLRHKHVPVILHAVCVLNRRCILLCACPIVIMLFGPAGQGAELKPKTLEAWIRYRSFTEQRIASELASKDGFLVQDFLPEKQREKCRNEVMEGRTCILQMQTLKSDDKKIHVPDGLIHHWVGSIRIPDAKLSNLVEWIQDYDKHERYFEEVERSRLLSRNGDAFTVFYRLKRKKVITVYYNTEHVVIYRLHDSTRISSTSRAIRIAELEQVGTPKEREKPIGNDHGFLWRLNTYWRFQQVGDAVVMSCESIGLSRAIPKLVSWFIRGIVNSVPRESLESTLEGIRDGFSSDMAAQQGVERD